MIKDITQNIIICKRWENEEIMPYSIDVPSISQKEYPLLNPITLAIDRLRTNIVKYGFKELNTSYVSERLWNTDVLLFPQPKVINSKKSTIYTRRTSGNINPLVLENTRELHSKIFGYKY